MMSIHYETGPQTFNINSHIRCLDVSTSAPDNWDFPLVKLGISRKVPTAAKSYFMLNSLSKILTVAL